MAKYRCRTLQPSYSSWYEVEAPTWQEAANTFHERELDTVRGFRFSFPKGEGRSETVVFALVEVDGVGQGISRVYLQGIRRKGGVRPLSFPTLREVAERLGWKGSPDDLLTPWPGEESWEEASDRKWSEGAIRRWGKKD